MDTRSKIIGAGEALERFKGKPVRRASGSFDPLLAEHVRRLRTQVKPGELLVVEVSNPPQPLLTQQARAELVAGLAFVDYVVLKDEESASDADVTAKFIQHVLRRHKEEQGG